MSKKILFEFFPELDIQAPQASQKNSKTPIMLLPSKKSQRVYTRARVIKRQLMGITIKNEEYLNRSQRIVLLKRFTNLKGYRVGKRKPLDRFPVLVFEKKLLLEGQVLVHGVLEDIIKEHLDIDG
jgi:hypothetical protein